MERKKAKCEMTKGERVTIALLQAVAVLCFIELVVTLMQCYGQIYVMNKKIFLEKLRGTFPDFELTLGDAEHVGGESVFVNGHSIELAWSPDLDILETKEAQCLEMLLEDVITYVQQACHNLSKDQLYV